METANQSVKQRCYQIIFGLRPLLASLQIHTEELSYPANDTSTLADLHFGYTYFAREDLSPRGMPVKEKRDDRAYNYSQEQKAENREEHADRGSGDRSSSRKSPKYKRED